MEVERVEIVVIVEVMEIEMAVREKVIEDLQNHRREGTKEEDTLQRERAKEGDREYLSVYYII